MAVETAAAACIEGKSSLLSPTNAIALVGRSTLKQLAGQAWLAIAVIATRVMVPLNSRHDTLHEFIGGKFPGTV